MFKLLLQWSFLKKKYLTFTSTELTQFEISNSNSRVELFLFPWIQQVLNWTQCIP